MEYVSAEGRILVMFARGEVEEAGGTVACGFVDFVPHEARREVCRLA
jgi:hypothetical protein